MADYLITRLPLGTTRAEIVQFFKSIEHPFLVSPKVDEITGFMFDFEESASVRSDPNFPPETKRTKTEPGNIKDPQRLVLGQGIGAPLMCSGSNPFSIQGPSSLFRPGGRSAVSSNSSLLQREPRPLNAADILTQTASGGPPSIMFSSGNPNVLDSIVKKEEEQEDTNPLFSQDPSRPQPMYSMFRSGTHAEALMEADAPVTIESFVKEEIDDGEFDDREDRFEEDGGKTLMETHKDASGSTAVFKCDLCSDSFSNLTSLHIHWRIHPLECELCQKRFAYRYRLLAHMRTHTGEKPHECTVCHKNFTQKSTLTQHLRTHTGEKPYECTVCGRKFTKRSNLTKHHRSFHETLA